jgi:hypothetical protein
MVKTNTPHSMAGGDGATTLGPISREVTVSAGGVSTARIVYTGCLY